MTTITEADVEQVALERLASDGVAGWTGRMRGLGEMVPEYQLRDALLPGLV